jgi:hypothetical protein
MFLFIFFFTPVCCRIIYFPSGLSRETEVHSVEGWHACARTSRRIRTPTSSLQRGDTPQKGSISSGLNIASFCYVAVS